MPRAAKRRRESGDVAAAQRNSSDSDESAQWRLYARGAHRARWVALGTTAPNTTMAAFQGEEDNPAARAAALAAVQQCQTALAAAAAALGRAGALALSRDALDEDARRLAQPPLPPSTTPNASWRTSRLALTLDGLERRTFAPAAVVLGPDQLAASGAPIERLLTPREQVCISSHVLAQLLRDTETRRGRGAAETNSSLSLLTSLSHAQLAHTTPSSSWPSTSTMRPTSSRIPSLFPESWPNLTLTTAAGATSRRRCKSATPRARLSPTLPSSFPAKVMVIHGPRASASCRSVTNSRRRRSLHHHHTTCLFGSCLARMHPALFLRCSRTMSGFGLLRRVSKKLHCLRRRSAPHDFWMASLRAASDASRDAATRGAPASPTLILLPSLPRLL
eukprot:m.79139 g.79139  ORF g.79139 m.79139 type:complete len:391 (-) comp8175_c0_seq2:513-1685(-)